MDSVKRLESSTNSASKAKNSILTLGRSLSGRNYQLYFFGQLVSLIGTWMQQLALSWLTYKLTNSPFMLGAVAFVGTAPSILLSPFAGVLSDRFNRHKLLIFTQCSSMILAFVLAALALTGHIQLWQIIIIGVLTGLVNAVDMPVRQAFVVDLVHSRNDLPNAIALNSSLMNLTRLLGPAIAGAVIAMFGEGVCFLANGLSYLGVIAALMAMRFPKPIVNEAPAHGIRRHIKEGFEYAFNYFPIRSLLIISAISSLAVMPLSTLMPALVKDTFHGGPATLGYLMSASAIGSLVGTVMLASRDSLKGIGRQIVVAMVLFSVAMMLFAFNRSFIAALVLLALIGFGTMFQMSASNTLLQTLVEDDKRGRVMSLYSMCFMGMMPMGSLLAGSLASAVGAGVTIFISGVVCLMVAGWLAGALPALRDKALPAMQRCLVEHG
jgi:MFS family permease